MCAIIGSFSLAKLKELLALNQHRGNFTFSITEFDSQTGRLVSTFRGCHPLTAAMLDVCDDERYYKVVHIQAPTGLAGVDPYTIHPAVGCTGMLLWHNGILKDYQIRELQKKHHSNSGWDTELVVHQLECAFEMTGNEEYKDNPFRILEKLDGSFACLFWDHNVLWAFRTTSAPLFVDKDMNISSLQCQDMQPLFTGRAFSFDFKARELVGVFNFQPKDNPYFFADEHQGKQE